MMVIASVAAMTAAAASGPQTKQPERSGTKPTPVVMVVGCAMATAQPHLWDLAHAGEPSASSRAGITAEEREQLSQRPLGPATYQLIGVADFVDAETSRKIGVRGEILTASRVNATGMLVSGHKVGVKGLYIGAAPVRINLTSVVDLGRSCP
jgi:hypothetical protein